MRIHLARVEAHHRQLLPRRLVRQLPVRLLVAVVGAAQPLAVQRQRLPRLDLPGLLLQPGVQLRLDLLLVHAGQNPPDRVQRRGHALPAGGVAPRPGPRQLLLRQLAPEDPDLGHVLLAFQARRQHDHQHRHQRMPQAARLAEIRDGAQVVPQRFELLGCQVDPIPFLLPGGVRVAPRQLRARVALQGVDEDGLGPPVAAVAEGRAAHAPEAAGKSQLDPVGSVVAGPAEALRIDKRLDQQRGGA